MFVQLFFFRFPYMKIKPIDYHTFKIRLNFLSNYDIFIEVEKFSLRTKGEIDLQTRTFYKELTNT